MACSRLAQPGTTAAPDRSTTERLERRFRLKRKATQYPDLAPLIRIGVWLGDGVCCLRRALYGNARSASGRENNSVSHAYCALSARAKHDA